MARPAPLLELVLLLDWMVLVPTVLFLRDGLPSAKVLILSGGWYVAPLAAACACTACVDATRRWFDDLVASQPAIINVDMDAPLGPRKPREESTAGGVLSPLVLERWLDQQRFGYHELARDVAIVARASAAAIILALITIALELVKIAVDLYLYPRAGSLLFAMWTYMALAVATVLILLPAARVHATAQQRCIALDVSLHQVPLHAVQQLQTLILRRSLAFTMCGYPLTLADLARAVVALSSAVLPGMVRRVV